MRFLQIAFGISLIITLLQVHVLIAKWSVFLSSACEGRIPSGPYHLLGAGIVCGTRIDADQYSQLFRISGLIHILVVSGAHLVFLEQILTLVGLKNQRLVGIVLFSFCLITGFQAPAVRAWFQWLIRIWNKSKNLHLTPPQSVFLSGILCLLICPTWIHSQSLLLSWACALTLTLVSSFGVLKQNLIMYLALFPFLLNLSPPHPLAILINTVVAPLMGAVLFPANLFQLALPILAIPTNYIWKILIGGLELAEPLMGNTEPVPISMAWLWASFFAAQIIGHTFHVKRMRNTP